MSIDDKCIWYDASRNQRKTELQRGDGLAGTENYEKMGCYNCNGYDLDCEVYQMFYQIWEDDNKLYIVNEEN